MNERTNTNQLNLSWFLAYSAYCNAIQTGAADVETHKNIIRAPNVTGYFWKAWLAYQNAVQTGLVDVETHNIMIAVAMNMTVVKADQLDLAWFLARKAYDNAIQAGVADGTTYNTMINVASKTGHFNTLLMVYDDAVCDKKVTDGATVAMIKASVIAAAKEAKRFDIVAEADGSAPLDATSPVQAEQTSLCYSFVRLFKPDVPFYFSPAADQSKLQQLV